MAEEFKISRLIFNWVGEWTDGTVYKRDDIAQYEGKSYVCIDPHTSSSNFYTDLNFPVFPRWELIVDGRVWKQDWQPTTFYSVGNIVRYSGIVYICTIPHTSGAEEIDLTKFNILARSGNWLGDWEIDTVYGIDDIVKYGGTVYRCLIGHVSTSVLNDGLEADQGLDSSAEKWEIVLDGIEYRGDWSGSSVRYKKNDIVKDGPGLYKCKDGHISSGTFDINYWDVWIPGLDFVSTWSAGTIYLQGETVVYGGYSYRSNIQNNSGNTPSTNSTAWTLLTEGYSLQNEWSSGSSYKIGDVVRRSGWTYAAIADNSGQDPSGYTVEKEYQISGSSGTTLKISSPDSNNENIVPGMIVVSASFARGQTVISFDPLTQTAILNEGPDGIPYGGEILTFVGINPTNWSLISPGVHWRGFWNDGITYNVGDIVVWDDATYRCVETHNPLNFLTPLGTPKENTRYFWTIYIKHDTNNAMNTQGDIVYNNGTENVALPISETETEILKVVNSTPSWETNFITPSLFYVATNGFDGTDYPDRGKTWDHPWKSIKYACEKIAAGTANTNTRNALIANKEWLLEEMWQWMEYQKDNSISPFNPLSTYDEVKTRRDASFVIDAIAYDITRGGNSQTVATATSYFQPGTTNTFFNAEVTLQMPYFIAALEYLTTLISSSILTNNDPVTNYQEQNGILPVNQITQTKGFSIEIAASTTILELTSLLLDALDQQSTEVLPLPNQGLTSTIYVKSGTYEEQLPIVIPANCAVVGDELRGTVVQPANVISTLATSTSVIDNKVTVLSTEGLDDNTPIQFVSTGVVLDDFANINPGQTYYVIGNSITSTQFSFSETEGGSSVSLGNDLGNMYVYGGDAIKDMFYMHNATGLRNMTLTGLLGTLSEQNAYLTQRPTGGAYVSLDPGLGPDDTSVWIYRRSPYIQNVTTFGLGCIGMKIDGTLHNGGNKSMVSNDFTQILSDGIGLWITGPGALTEAVSVFSYYNYAGYFAEDGGRIRATNGNSSYGTYGVIAEGFDNTETPITGLVDNRSTEATANVQSSFGIDSLLLKLQYSNAGLEYNSSTTNMLKYSNNFVDGWTTDGNVLLAQNIISPSGYADGWSLTGTTSSTDSSYLYQNFTITPPGATYTALSAINISGSGSLATFNVTVNATSYVVTVNAGGGGYVATNQMYILGSELGGRDGVNDLTITVATLLGSAIQTVTSSGTVPTGSNLNHTVSIYAKKGSSSQFSISAIFSGSSTKESYLTYNFDSNTLTPASGTGSGLLPTLYGKEVLNNNWYRVWFSVYDTTALNNTLQVRLYPRGKTGNSGYTYFYGSQSEIGSGEPGFYLDTENTRYTAYANYHVTGAGTGVVTVGDEIRSNGIYQVRVTDDNDLGAGGSGYLTASNNAQGGNPHFIILSQSDINEPSNYERMRVFINSGTGAGQYAYIGNYNPSNKYAYVLKESFTPLTITSTSGSTNEFTLDVSNNTKELYIDMPIQFIPTYYTTEVTSASQETQIVNQSIGGLINQLKVTDTTKLTQWMPISFSGTVFGGVVTNYTYYVSLIVDATTIQISAELFGASIFLNSAVGSMTLLFPANNNYFIADDTSNMTINMPIQFTGVAIGGIEIGTTYYINDVINGTTFTMSDALIDITATNTAVTTNIVTVDDTTNLTSLNPIIFSGSNFGGLVKDTKYYISRILGVTTLTLSSSLTSVTCTATAATSNLITVSSTSGFVVDNPIKFVGTTFGNIVSGQIYYILAINNLTTFTISTTVGGSSVVLSTAVGECTAKTTPASLTLSNDTGSMEGTTTTELIELESGVGSMTATFSTSIFGGIQAGVDYYIYSITPGNPSTFQITATEGGLSPFTLTTASGSMQIGEVGWDHVNAGTPIEEVLDSTTLYFIEARPEFSHPDFTQTATTPISLGPSNSWVDIAYGNNYWIAIAQDGATAMGSSNGETWSTIVLPFSTTPTGIAYGNNYWVIITDTTEAIESGSRVLYSNSNGAAWRKTFLPSKTTWSAIAYGNGVFVAIANGTSTAAYSLDHGKTWVSATGLPNNAWTSVTYGAGKFIAVATGSSTAAYSTNGQTWTSTTLALSSAWADIAFGDGKFIAVSGDLAETVTSFDGITWFISKNDIQADKITYGQGVFLAVYSGSSTTAYTTEDGLIWKENTITDSGYNGLAFGYDSLYNGKFLTVAGTNISSSIETGSKPKGRVTVTSGTITEITIWEPGSGLSGSPTLTITDPNITIPVTTNIRTGNGILSSPTFVSRGTGYNTNSTVVRITGDGFADEYQTGLALYFKNITKLPRPGDNLVINGNTTIYKVTNAIALNGTSAPNLDAEIQISPDMTVSLSPDHEETVEIRQLYSQVRLTGHDFLNIGFGNFIQSNYPDLPTVTQLSAQNQAIENNYGRVFYTSTDQDGNFKVGDLFGVEQATGIVTLSASQFGLQGLETLKLGGVAVGNSSVIISQFSTDPTFIANSNQVVPTQKAIRSYLTSRLTQGGSNTFTGQLTAGTVVVGGPDQISSTIPEGIAGEGVRMTVKVNIAGPNASVDGDMAAFFMFAGSFWRQ